MYLCAFVGSLLPPPPARRHPLCFCFFGASSVFNFVCAFFFRCPPGRALRCSRAPCVCPLVFSVLPLSTPLCALSHACFPCHPRSLCGPCLLFSERPLSVCRAVTRVCHARALPLPLTVVPTLSPDGSPTLVFFPRFLSLFSSGMPWFTVCAGGSTCGLDCGSAHGRVRH